MRKKWEILGKGKRQKAKGKSELIVKQLLKNRGLTERKEIEEFLNPQISNIQDQAAKLIDSAQIKKAIKRINQAIKTSQAIVIHGDYDVDGICGTAILYELFYQKLDYKNTLPFIPHRLIHGYGMSKESIDEIRNSLPVTCYPLPFLLITTDCGISAIEAVDYAKSLGFDIIITDHHTKPRTLPKAHAILHTEKLSGTGIAWLLAEMLIRKSEIRKSEKIKTNSLLYQSALPAEESTNSLDLVALATVADLQPLLEMNRILVKHGLEKLNRTVRVGLQALVKVAGLENKNIGTYEVGWMLAPRLNAAGRLKNALDSLRLLCTNNQKQAWEIAQELNHINKERQQLTQKSYEQAEVLVTRYSMAPTPTLRRRDDGINSALQDTLPTTQNILVLHHEEWHEGIIGLVAAKMVEKHYRPAIAIARGKTLSKGSARSIKEINIVEIIRECQDLLIDVGGHPMAAGFTLETTKIEEFTRRISNIVHGKLANQELSPMLQIDTEIDLADINWELLSELKKFEPHGISNLQPVFLTRNVEIVDLRLVGKQNDHLKLKVKSQKSKVKKNSQCSMLTPRVSPGKPSPQSLDAIGFGLGHFYSQLDIGDKIDIIYSIEENNWNNNHTLQLKLKDLHKSES